MRGPCDQTKAGVMQMREFVGEIASIVVYSCDSIYFGDNVYGAAVNFSPVPECHAPENTHTIGFNNKSRSDPSCETFLNTMYCFGGFVEYCPLISLSIGRFLSIG